MVRVVHGIASAWSRHHLTFPLALVTSVLALGLSIWRGAAIGDFASQMLAGATFLAAAMVNALLRVWTWADANDAQVSRLTGHVRNEQPLREHLRHRFDGLEQVQTIAAVATALSVVLILTLIVAIVHPPFDTAPDADVLELAVPALNSWATHLAIALSSAVGICLFGIVAETVAVGSEALRGSRTTVGAQSGHNG